MASRIFGAQLSYFTLQIECCLAGYLKRGPVTKYEATRRTRLVNAVCSRHLCSFVPSSLSGNRFPLKT